MSSTDRLLVKQTKVTCAFFMLRQAVPSCKESEVRYIAMNGAEHFEVTGFINHTLLVGKRPTA
jgi:uncharacterized protein YbbK (DUF523 family)